MIEKILVLLLPLIYLVTFIARNLIVKAKVKQRIRSSDPLTTTAIILYGLCIFVTILSVFSENFYVSMGVISFLRAPVVSYAGLFLFGICIAMGWMISAQLKESWRVGVHEGSKTELIQEGVYAYIRNPYFLFYFIMFLSLFLVRPSIVMMALVIITIIAFHNMVLREEVVLMKMHGEDYGKYMNRTGRYIPRSTKRH